MKRLLREMTLFEKRLLLLYAASSICLFLYSFTQVDLGLTLTRSSWITDVQKAFQYIGYFNRPLSTLLFIVLLGIFFALYVGAIRAIRSNKVSEKVVWLTILVITIILTFSYTALSHDIFNYIFDAKIITAYKESPYEHKALDYPNDPMLGFMHWTHRTYPYGPVWLALTVPLSYLGLQVFLPTYFLFKILSAASYLLATLAVFKIAKKLSPGNYLVGTALFALNPLVIFETLLSGHNDLTMMAFALFALLYLIQKKYVLSLLLLSLSIGIKYATALLVPLFLFFMTFQKNLNVSTTRLIYLATILMALAVIVASMRTNFQPWYLLYLLPFAVFIPTRYVLAPIIILSAVALANYIPYLYIGNWNPPIPSQLQYLNLGGVILSVGTGVYFFLSRKISRKVSSD